MKKYPLILIFICLALSYKLFQTSYFPLELSEQEIEVTVKGEVKEEKVVVLPMHSNFSDLLNHIELTEVADISMINPQQVLHHLDIVVIPIKSVDKLISINYATVEELMSLPGIGEKTALSIVEYRNTYGLFQSLDDLMNVKGIGLKKYEKLKDYITL